MSSAAGGLILAIVAGACGGSFGLPMKFVSGWAWENTWFSYCFFGAWVLPIVYCLSTTLPHTGAILHSNSVIPMAFLGLGWGASSVLFGLGLARVGQSITFGIVLSLASTFGSVVPMLIFNRPLLVSTVGVFFWLGLAVGVVGVVVISFAGVFKERELAKTKANADAKAKSPESDPESNTGSDLIASPPGSPAYDDADSSVPPTGSQETRKKKGMSSMQIGLIICIVSGVLSALINIALALSGDVTAKARAYGVRAIFESSAPWLVAIGSGNIVNIMYCVVLLFKNDTWKVFREQTAKTTLMNIGITCFMGLLWFLGMSLYAIGATLVGRLGTSIGWPINLMSQVVAANICSVITGEWRGTEKRSRLLMVASLFILAVAIILLGVGSAFPQPSTVGSTSASSSSR